MHTTTEAAAQIGCAAVTVRNICARHGIGRRVGPVRLLDDADIDRLRTLYQGGPGNPQFGSAEMSRKGVMASQRKRAERS